MNSYASRVAGIPQRLRERASPLPEDELLLSCFRLLLGSFLLLWARAIYVPALRRLERPAKALAHRANPSASEMDGYEMAVDLYKLIMTVLTFIVYAITWCVQGGELWRRILTATLAVFILARVAELVSALGLLFLSRPSPQARTSFRPVANAFWSYVEFGLAFAVLYCILCSFSPGAISASNGEQVVGTFSGALYFSFTTLTTVGYGDFTAQTGLARFLACSEALTGLFLTVVLVQKALGRTPDTAPQPAGGAPKPPDT